MKIHDIVYLGYSWHTNQYGLTLDTVEAFELVKPNGEVVQVTHESDPELFFALKVRYSASVWWNGETDIRLHRVVETTSCIRLYLRLESSHLLGAYVV